MDTKFFLKSRGIWGGVVPVVLGMAGLLGLNIAPGMEEEATALGNSLLDALSGGVESIALVSAGFLSLWSRLRTERKPLTVTPKTS